MTVRDYYRHARAVCLPKMAPALECLTLAREAAALDLAAERARRVPYIETDRETVGGVTLRLSRSIRVF